MLTNTNKLTFGLSFPTKIGLYLQASVSDSDMALGMNRYLCNSVLPLLTNYCEYFKDADFASELMDTTLHTVYRLSKCRCLTKNQRDTVSDFLVAYTRYVC